MSKLTNYDAGCNEGAWEAFSEATGIGQQPEQTRRAAWWWFGGAGLLMVLGLVIFGRGEKCEERRTIWETSRKWEAGA